MSSINSETLLRSCIRWSVFVFILLLLLWVGTWVAVFVAAAAPDHGQFPNLLTQLSGQLSVVAISAWQFARPLLQLLIVLLIFDYVLTRLGISLRTEFSRIEWNVQTIVALVIVGSFAAAALGGITEGLSSLKDLALVVVGFYFGSQRRVLEVETAAGKIKQVVEHDNPAFPQEAPNKPDEPGA